MSLKSRDLAIFDAVVRQGSIQAAADTMGLTQSAVSRVVQKLEASLGHSLLDRTMRPIQVTRDGERAIVHARKVLAALDEMAAAFSDDQVPAITFRLGIPHALIRVLLDAEHMLGLDEFPQLRVAVFSGWSDELLARLSARELDAAITITQTHRLPEGTAPLIQSAVRVVAAQEHEASAKDLQSANAVGWALNPVGCGYRKALFSALEKVGETPNVVLETNSLDLQLQFTRAGRALTLAPEFLQGISGTAPDLSFVRTIGLDASVAILLHRPHGEESLEPVYKALEAQTMASLNRIPKTHI